MKGDEANLYMCEVEGVEDDQDGLRIKVRIPPYDGKELTVDELPYAFPLLPKHLHVNPKVGEMVLVMFQKSKRSGTDRFFIGPIISQPYMMNHDPYKGSARSLFNGTQTSVPKESSTLDPDNAGTLPDRNDIALEGRKNADIVLKDSEVRIRCGYKEYPDSANWKDRLHRNKGNDQAYIQMKFRKWGRHNKKGGDYESRFGFASAINMVADRINLLSHDSRTTFDLNDPKELITDDEMDKILEKAHPVVYGDDLIAWLNDFRNVFMKHTHPFPTREPSLDQKQKSVVQADLDQLLSTSIRVN